MKAIGQNWNSLYRATVAWSKPAARNHVPEIVDGNTVSQIIWQILNNNSIKNGSLHFLFTKGKSQKLSTLLWIKYWFTGRLKRYSTTGFNKVKVQRIIYLNVINNMDILAVSLDATITMW